MLKEYITKWKSDYLKKGPIFRLFLILIITIWLNFFVYTTIKIPSEELNKIYLLGDNTTYLEIPSSFSLLREDLDAGNIGGILWRLIYIRSKTDIVCFENKGSFLKYDNRVIYNAMITQVSYNKGDFFEVKNKECRNLPREDNKFTFNWRFETDMSFLNDILKESKNKIISEEDPILINKTQYLKMAEITMHPNVKTYIKPGWKTGIFKFIFLFFSTGALLWAWSRTFFIIKHGCKG